MDRQQSSANALETVSELCEQTDDIAARFILWVADGEFRIVGLSVMLPGVVMGTTALWLAARG